MHVTIEPPWVTIDADKELRGIVVYYGAIDAELNGWGRPAPRRGGTVCSGMYSPIR